MKIPKTIHYCWLGGNELPPIAKKCIKSWKKYCPDYEIIRWDETNFDMSENVYTKQAYENGKWAFASDYMRLKIIHDYGGVYLDTDVELIKSLDDLLEQGGYMGFDEKGIVATGLGFAAEPGNRVIAEMLKDYEDIPFVLPDGTFDMTPCPDRNTNTLKRLGMDVSLQQSEFMDMHFLPQDYLCPMDYYTGKKEITENTYSIHHYSASWTSKVTKRTTFIKRLIGVKMYNKIYGKFLQNCNWLEW